MYHTRTIRILGCDYACASRRLADANWVLSHHPELVLPTFLQVIDSIDSVSDGAFVDTNPARARRTLAL